MRWTMWIISKANHELDLYRAVQWAVPAPLQPVNFELCKAGCIP